MPALNVAKVADLLRVDLLKECFHLGEVGWHVVMVWVSWGGVVWCGVGCDP